MPLRILDSARKDLEEGGHFCDDKHFLAEPIQKKWFQ